MRRLALLSLVALAAGCSKPDSQPAQDTTAAAPPAPAARAFVTVIYNAPKNPAAFEKYYWESHVPLVGQHQAEVGFTEAELTKFDAAADGKAAPYYRQAVLWFNSMADLEKGIATPGFKAIGDDLANFATGGLIAMIGEQTNQPSPLVTGDTTSFVTVLYNAPKDPSAFESYYTASHLPLVANGGAEMGFVRGELTRFVRNLDGSAPAFYRQAKLYWPSEATRTTGLATPAAKAVIDDLSNFADGGFVGIVGHVTSKP